MALIRCCTGLSRRCRYINYRWGASAPAAAGLVAGADAVGRSSRAGAAPEVRSAGLLGADLVPVALYGVSRGVGPGCLIGFVSGVSPGGLVPVDEVGAATQALLAIARDVGDDRVLAEQICRTCAKGLDLDGAAISVLTQSEARETLCATDATAELLEELQFALGEGACMQAALTGRPVLVPDMDNVAVTGRWPIFAVGVAERATVGALFALPLQWGAIRFGVLDLYRTAPGSMTGAQLRDAVSAADVAALMLIGLRTDPGDRLWDHSWRTRAEIHQATGMVLAQLGVSAQDAFARLRAYAFAEQRLLGDVAADVVSRSHPPPQRGGSHNRHLGQPDAETT
jgi:hypothetical protein